MMATLWFTLVALMVAVYVVLDGFDLGTGIVHWGVGRNEQERTLNIRAIGPVWDGNEVWLLAAGGTLYFAFPPLYAAGFSGFYLPLMMVLWCLMGRGISVEFRNHVDDPMWRTLFDALFTVCSALLAIFLGAALGNVIRGVPLNEEGYFFTPLFTDFRVGPEPGVLDWYTVLIGLISLLALAMHGAIYLAVKTEGEQNSRAKRIALAAWFGTCVLTIAAAPATALVRPEIGASYRAHAWMWFLPLLTIIGLAIVRLRLNKNEKQAFIGSSIYLAGTLAAAVFGLYPLILPSSGDPARSLTIHNSAAHEYGLKVGLIWWTVGAVLATFYFVHLYKMFRGKVTESSAAYSHD